MKAWPPARIAVVAGAFALGAVMPKLAKRARCLVRGYHDPARHPMGALVCVNCGKRASDMAGLGFEDSHVSAEYRGRR